MNQLVKNVEDFSDRLVDLLYTKPAVGCSVFAALGLGLFGLSFGFKGLIELQVLLIVKLSNVLGFGLFGLLVVIFFGMRFISLPWQLTHTWLDRHSGVLKLYCDLSGKLSGRAILRGLVFVFFDVSLIHLVTWAVMKLPAELTGDDIWLSSVSIGVIGNIVILTGMLVILFGVILLTCRLINRNWPETCLFAKRRERFKADLMFNGILVCLIYLPSLIGILIYNRANAFVLSIAFAFVIAAVLIFPLCQFVSLLIDISTIRWIRKEVWGDYLLTLDKLSECLYGNCLPYIETKQQNKPLTHRSHVNALTVHYLKMVEMQASGLSTSFTVKNAHDSFMSYKPQALGLKLPTETVSSL